MNTEQNAVPDQQKPENQPLPLIVQPATAVSSLTGTLSTWLGLSIYHLEAAALFARQATSIVDPSQYMAHTGYVIGSVCSSAFFLEAAINEVYLTAVAFPNDSSTAKLGTGVVKQLGDAWNQGTVDRLPVLEKFNRAVDIAGKRELGQTKGIPYADIDVLIDFRNYLVHYKAEIINMNAKGFWAPNTKVATFLLKNCLNTKLNQERATFPLNVLSDKCAAWAVRTSARFMDGSLRHIGIDSPFAPRFTELLTELG